ncbi:MAG: BsuPI-related putative proteinase inhibitor [Chloroflexi bacterium]|nr:BsuPI-related putative proteinase inhibitor [Chloroflexota bacterium]
MTRRPYVAALFLLLISLAIVGCTSPQAGAAPSPTALRSTPTLPAPTAAPVPTVAPTPTQAAPQLPAGYTRLREVEADLRGNGQKERVILAAQGASADKRSAQTLELFVFSPGPGGYSQTWHSDKLLGDRAEPLQVEDINKDGRPEVLSVQSMGAAGETLYVFGWQGDHYGFLAPQGGYFGGRQSFGDTGVRLEDLNGDGVPEIVATYGPAASESTTYRWDGKEYRAVTPPAPTSQSGSTPAPGSRLTLDLATGAPTYITGTKVSFKLTARNAGTTPVTLSFASGQRFDMVVQDATGREIWRWSAGRVFTQVMSSQELAPGQSLTYDATWDQKDPTGQLVSPGRYSARSWLTARGVPQQATVEFSVAAR